MWYNIKLRYEALARTRKIKLFIKFFIWRISQ